MTTEIEGSNEHGEAAAGRGRYATWAAIAAQCLGGLCLLLSLRYPLTGHGPGSAISMRNTADLLLGGTVEAWAPRWAGLALYLPGLLGAVLIMLAGLIGTRARGAALLVAALLVVLCALVAFGLGSAVAFRQGPGFRLLGLGSVLALFGSLHRRPRRRRSTVAGSMAA